MTVLCAALCVICFFDYGQRRIPNWMVILIGLIGVGRNIYLGDIREVARYLLTLVVVLFLFYPLFRIGGLGAGDVKLLSVCSGYFPVNKIFSFLFISLLFSAIFSMIQLFRERNVKDRISYFCEYCVAVAKSGKWRLYFPQKDEKRIYGVCMSGPILCSVLLGLGGVY